MYNPVIERRVEFLAEKERYERNLQHEISSVMQFFDDNGATIVNCCSPETQHRVFEAQETARFAKNDKFLAKLKNLQKEVQDEIKHSSL